MRRGEMKSRFALLLAAVLLAGCHGPDPLPDGSIGEPPPAASSGSELEVSAPLEPPLPDWVKEQPVPEFLDEEQQQLFLHAFCAISFLGGVSTGGVENFPLADGSLPVIENYACVELDGWTYVIAQWRYRRWEDFQAMLDGLFTPAYQEELLRPPQGDGTVLHRFRPAEDGLMCFLEADRGSDLEYDWCETPDSYELTSRSEDEIRFDLIGHYAILGYDEETEMPVPEGEYTRRFPIRMEHTGQGWRVAEIHVPW